jgi:nucleoside-diphosphate-sugar epimerase
VIVPPSPVVIAGAGFLGAPLAARLAAAGTAVIATTRTGRWPGGVPPAGISVRALDTLADPPERVRETLAGAAAIVSCISATGGQDRRAVYVEGTRKLIDAARQLRPARLIQLSSTSALPDRDAVVDEDCADWPEHDRGRIQREAEALALSLTADAIPALVLRLAGLWGPGRELFRIYRSDPTGVLPGDGMEATNLVHRDDALAAILAALGRSPPATGLIHVCDDDHRPRRELFEGIARAADLPPPRFERPAGPARGKRVANERMKRVLGVVLAHPHHGPGGPGDKPAACVPRSGG